MVNFEKIVKGADIVLNCIPIVNTINNAAQAIYKLAHKVDALNPVAPGLKTSIKIHLLSKNNFDFFIESTLILGNLVAFGKLALSIFRGFNDDLMKAVIQNNTEVVHLCIGNNALNDLDRADRIFAQSAHSSNNEVFRQVLHSRDDWSAQNLMNGLRSCLDANDNNVANANNILDFWTAHERALPANEGQTYSATLAFESFLKKGKVDLAWRVLEILLGAISFHYTQAILLNYSCAQYNHQGEVEKTGILTNELRNLLISKSKRPSLEQLKEYFVLVGYQLKNVRTADNYRETHFDTLNKLLVLARLKPDEMGDFVAHTINHDEFTFIEPLVANYERQLSPQVKMKILTRLLTCNSGSAYLEKRTQLFASWIDRWKQDVSAQAHELYTGISNSGELNIKMAQARFQTSASAERDYPSVENLQAVNAKFKQILLETFPWL